MLQRFKQVTITVYHKVIPYFEDFQRRLLQTYIKSPYYRYHTMLENKNKTCTEFGDENKDSPNSMMNSSSAGIGHIYAPMKHKHQAQNTSEIHIRYKQTNLLMSEKQLSARSPRPEAPINVWGGGGVHCQ